MVVNPENKPTYGAVSQKDDAWSSEHASAQQASKQNWEASLDVMISEMLFTKRCLYDFLCACTVEKNVK